MKIFGLEINKGDKFSELQNNFSEIKKQLLTWQKLRPNEGNNRTSEGEVKIPIYPISQEKIYSVALQSDVLLTVINALRDNIFRRGTLIKENGENDFEYSSLNKILKKINDNNQSLIDVCKMFERDLNIMDDAYLISLKDYIFDLNGDISDWITREIVIAKPTRMGIIADSQGRLGYNDKGQNIYLDLTNRSYSIDEKTAEGMGFVNKQGIKLQQACYRAQTGKEGEYIYYMESEVFHCSKYNPTMLYGYSNIFSIWMKIVTLIEQDRYLLLNYQKGRPPRGILAFNTTNYDSVKKAWEALKEEAKKDPHSISPMILENKEGVGKAVEWINLMNPLQDMQFIESRNEMRRQIGAIYGVMPLFSGDISQAGGLNNESQQLTVTNRSVELGQKIYNEKVFPWILKQFKINTYELELLEPEEKDEIKDEKTMGIKIDNAVKMSQMGFKVSFNQEEEKFEYSNEQVSQPNQNIFGPNQTNLSSQDIGKEFIDLKYMVRDEEINKKIREFLDIEKEDILKEDNLIFDIKKADNNFISFISKQLYEKSFEGLTKEVSDKIKDVVLKSLIQRTTISEVINKIKELGVSENQSELIARTESSILKNSAREFNYSQVEGNENFLYKWIGPDDNRTSDISKEIKSKSKNGLKLETLKNLVRKTSEKYGFKPDRDWFSHPNQRHIFTRKLK